MRIFSAEQIRRWDEATIEEQRISPFELMERAAFTCSNWLVEHDLLNRNIQIFCGTGNNGGDGFAIARILSRAGANIKVHALPGDVSELNLENRNLLENIVQINFLAENKTLPAIDPADVVIEAIFGTGLKRAADGLAARLIEHINNSGSTIISIDMPGGLSTDDPLINSAITATHTLTFQQYKYSFFFAENEKYIGKVHLVDIGLSPGFAYIENSKFVLTEENDITSIIRPRNSFSHKGDHGHAALVAGSMGMMGAAVLAAKGCLYSGAGKLTCYVPEIGYNIIQTTVPAAMAKITGRKRTGSLKLMSVHSAVGAGPGAGRQKNEQEWIRELLSLKVPLVLDADALNILADNKALLNKLLQQTILTPHPREFQRLFGNVSNAVEAALEAAKRLSIYIILKGKYSCIATPEGRGYFNPTGNAGMARGGMGDVLTGILTGLRAQGYSAFHTCLLGVYWHGLSADIAVQNIPMQTLQPEDVINHLGTAWKKIEGSG